MIVRCDDCSNSRECIITRRYTRHRGHVSTIKIGQCSSQLFSVKSHNILDSCSHCTDQWTNSRVSIGYQEISGIFYNESARIYLSGCGLGNYSAAVFHLFTHAFFKGLLFLSSGVVIHSIDGVLKTYRLGGLNKLLSIGHGLMVSGSLALVGLPFLAGFYSKELIIICSFSTYL